MNAQKLIDEVKSSFYLKKNLEKVLCEVIDFFNLQSGSKKHACSNTMNCGCEPIGLILIKLLKEIHYLKSGIKSSTFNFKLNWNLPSLHLKAQKEDNQMALSCIKFMYSLNQGSINEFMEIFFQKPQMYINSNLALMMIKSLIESRDQDQASHFFVSYTLFSSLFKDHEVYKMKLGENYRTKSCPLFKLYFTHIFMNLNTTQREKAINSIKQADIKKEIMDEHYKRLQRSGQGLQFNYTTGQGLINFSTSITKIGRSQIHDSYTNFYQNFRNKETKNCLEFVKKRFDNLPHFVKSELENLTLFEPKGCLIYKAYKLVMSKPIIYCLILYKISSLTHALLTLYPIRFNLLSRM